MNTIIKSILLLSICTLIVFIVSIIPFRFVPQKIISISNITPSSISEYGYIDIFNLKYLVKNFSYIANFEDDSIISIKANKFSVGMLNKKDVNLLECNIIYITDKDKGEVIDNILDKIFIDQNEVDIKTEKCTFEIRQVSKDIIDNLKKEEKIKYDSVSAINGDFIIQAEDVDLSLYKNNFLINYKFNGRIFNNEVHGVLSSSQDEEKISIKIGETNIEYIGKKMDTKNSLIISSKEWNDFVQKYFCENQYCKIFSSRIFGNNFNLTINKDSSDKKWVGSFYGSINGKIEEKEDKIFKISINQATLDNQEFKNKIFAEDSKISLYSIFDRYINIKDINIDLNIKKLIGQNFEISDLKFITNLEKDQIDFSAKYNKDGMISTKIKDLSKLKILWSNINFKNFLNLFSLNKNYNKFFKEKEISDLYGDFEINFSKYKDDIYPESINFLFNNKSNVEIKMNQCLNKCQIGISINNIDLFKYTNKENIVDLIGIDYIVKNLDAKQGALLYKMSEIINLPKNKSYSFDLSMSNVAFGEDFIKDFVFSKYINFNQYLIELKQINSSFINGNSKVKISFNDGKIPKIEISSNFDKFQTKNILRNIYTESNLEEIGFSIPSLAGFDGIFDFFVKETNSDMSNIKLSGNIENGVFKFSNGTFDFFSNKIKTNGLIDFNSKPSFVFGIAIQSLDIEKFFLKEKFNKIKGILNLTGDVSFAGFTLNDFKSSLEANLSGKLYNMQIQKTNLQMLSKNLINLNNINSLSINDVLESGSVSFREVISQIKIEKGILNFTFTNAKSTGVSGSGNCGWEIKSNNLKNCKATFIVMAKDLRSENSFIPLQIGWAGGGKITDPLYQWNFDQINQYKIAAIKYKNLS